MTLTLSKLPRQLFTKEGAESNRIESVNRMTYFYDECGAVLGLTQEDERMPKGPNSGGAGTILDEVELINVGWLPREVWDWCKRQQGPPIKTSYCSCGECLGANQAQTALWAPTVG